jgi:hypothetical protein
MATVGETISEVFETGVTGETFTPSFVQINGVDAVWDPNITELSGGFYKYSFVPEVPGFYSWSGLGSASGPLTINIEIDPAEAGAAVPPVSPGTPFGHYTLNDLIEHVALRSMDLVQASATSNADDNLTFSDLNNLIEDHAFYAGMEIYFKSGANAGLTRRVADSNYDTGLLSWELGITTPILFGDEINLYNRSGLGHTYREYRQALNMCIREVGGNVMQRVAVDLPLPSWDNPAVSLDPAAIAKVCRISYTDATGARQSLRRNRRNGWWAEHGVGTVTFTGAALGVVSYSTPPLQAHGYARATELLLPTDATFIDAEWLVETAAGLLQNANPDNAGNLAPGQYLRNRADAMRGKMATPFDANCVSVG